jgi:preprotein translocase subunit SecB
MTTSAAKPAIDDTKANLPQPEFIIQRVYVKDASFESPHAPKVFQENLQPSINLNIHTGSTILDKDTHEVVLTTTITASVEERTIFLIEVKQAGIFTLKNIPEQNMGTVLGVTCPTILFPYVREAVSELAAKGSFQHFYLAPINFEALYMNSLQQKGDETKH